MQRVRRAFRWSFQTRVLAPVVSIMVLLVVVPLWLVMRRMSAQLETSAADNLRANDAVFQNLQAIRSRNLLLRYGGVANEPRFRAVLVKAVIESPDPNTLRALLNDVREELGADMVLFADGEGRAVAGAVRDAGIPLEPFATRARGILREALAGEANVDTLSVGSHPFDVVSIPVSMGTRTVGALVFGNEVGEAAAKEFTQLTRSEVVLLASGTVATATLNGPGLQTELQTAGALSSNGAKAGKLTVSGEHFMFVVGQLGKGEAAAGVGYILLTSYEKPLRVLLGTKRTFLWIQLLGIVAGTAIVCGLVRRVTRPLRELRDTAEAVGAGDFSRRVNVTSRDECGELATVFNRMTANLKTSREELEKTVDTLKSTQAQLVQSEKLRAIGTLAGGIAHDFNNILGAILGFGELVIEDVPAESRAAKNLRQVLKAGKRAKDLVRQILAFSRATEPQRTNVRLSVLIDETMKLLRATVPATIQLQTRINATADTVVADATQLHQVLMNLGTNAAHAMRETGGSFTLSLDELTLTGEANSPQLPPGRYLRLGATDTGHGMDAATLGRIFEPFFTTKPVGEGTGLGLSAVHGIIKNHGGEIVVTSQPGAGTTFQIYLPAAAADAAANGDTVIIKAAPGARECVLVVDDEEPLVNMMEQKLTRLGYEVVACADSVEALEKFKAAPRRFSVVITDQNMPRLTGCHLADEIARLRADTPVILCSGSRAMAGPGSKVPPAVRECVPKPVDFGQLSRIIRKVIEDKPTVETLQP